jgi:asparagine synthase (glutamine-hydrolysing)
MCGITGFVDFNGHDRTVARERIQRMSDVLLHRGPDEGGCYVDEFAALGHRRLSIIDLSTGQQPMSALDGAVQIVFNGEIYNFLDVQADLEKKGHSFMTHSDTEVILRAYVEWGDRCVERLNGMFAFAIWDRRSKRLVLARDRVGKKPLYYYQVGSVITFASELKAMRGEGLCPASIDPEALDCYLSLGYVPAPRTIYAGVKKLLPARVVSISERGAVEREYWQLSFSELDERSNDDAVDEFEEVLDDAVRCRLTSEVPLGAFLSGGIDSSLVVSSMSRLLDQPVLTHTIGFNEPEFSELVPARAIASHLGTEHREFVVEPRAADVLDKIAWHFDEPFADASALPTWYVCEMTRQSVTVVLSGDGGDEGFGGYTFRYLPHVYEARLRARMPPALRATLFGPLASIWPTQSWLPKALRLQTIFENLAASDAAAFYHDLCVFRAGARAALYSPDFVRTLKGFTPFEIVQPYYSHARARDSLGRSQLTDIKVYMTDDVLVKVDRMSMAHSLEVRSPLLDHRVLEFAARLPASAKIAGRRGKVILRALAARRLPPEIHELPKRGFTIPIADWQRGELRSRVEELIFDTDFVGRMALDMTEMTRLWREHLRNERNHEMLFWGLMMLGLWQRAHGASA